MTAADIIARFAPEGSPENNKGVQALATHLGIPMTTVSAWRIKNHIPTWRQPRLLELAHRFNIDLSTADFPAKPSEQAEAA